MKSNKITKVYKLVFENCLFQTDAIPMPSNGVVNIAKDLIIVIFCLYTLTNKAALLLTIRTTSLNTIPFPGFWLNNKHTD